MIRWFRAIATLLVAVCIAGTAAAQTPGEPFTPAQRDALRQLMREYILQNPEVLIEALESLEERRRTEGEQRARQMLVERREQIFNNPANPVLGNPEGNVTVVEFFDYRCPYCKQMHAPINQLRNEDRQIRFVHIQLPILGPDSVIASRAALAARAQNRYPQFHDALMTARGNLDEAAIIRIAQSSGLDIARLRIEMSNPAILQALDANRRLAEELGVTGTPAFVIGDRLIPGAVDPATLRGMIQEARAAAPR
ncbi:MAG: DsbA family protein [Alphaproteobacteria bacterium]|nr:DsbA family protein [Alphaproteobacteria bacterium]